MYRRGDTLCLCPSRRLSHNPKVGCETRPCLYPSERCVNTHVFSCSTTPPPLPHVHTHTWRRIRKCYFGLTFTVSQRLYETRCSLVRVSYLYPNSHSVCASQGLVVFPGTWRQHRPMRRRSRSNLLLGHRTSIFRMQPLLKEVGVPGPLTTKETRCTGTHGQS